MTAWPDGARGAISLSFDNLGEAAEIEFGSFPADAPLGEHFTATRVLPSLLDALRDRDLTATFFVEGLNAEIYPEALEAIASGGHEIGCHAWRHEQWRELSVAEQTENLARGVAAFAALGLEIAGMRPPGGQMGVGGTYALREAGLRYCSPAGKGAGVEDNIALLPFQWRHVDASCVLPPLAPIREQMTGSPDPIDPGAFLAYLEGEIEVLARHGGFASIVLHLSMLDWLGEGRLMALIDKLASTDLWLARCNEVADHVLASSADFGGGATLDPASWA